MKEPDTPTACSQAQPEPLLGYSRAIQTATPGRHILYGLDDLH
jgi:hypothetical protein